MVQALTYSGLTAQELAERVQAYVRRNLTPFVAAERVIADLCREGRQNDLLAFLGPAALFEVWEQSRQAQREPSARRLQLLERGRETQRLNREALKQPAALLDTLVEIGGVWRRLGDLTRADCLRAAGLSKRKALDTAHRARWFHAVAQTLADGEVVSQRHDDQTLARLYEEAAR